MGEIWKAVIGYEGLYEVSNLGEVRGLKNNKGRRSAPRPLKGCKTHDGYLRVCLSKDGVAVRKKIHHLVLEAFVGPRPEGFVACHRDDNGLNNAVENLRWGTVKSNYEDRDTLGGTAKGERHGCATIYNATARKVKIAAQVRDRLARDIAKEFNVSVSQVRNIRNRSSWAWLEI